MINMTNQSNKHQYNLSHFYSCVLVLFSFIHRNNRETLHAIIQRSHVRCPLFIGQHINMSLHNIISLRLLKSKHLFLLLFYSFKFKHNLHTVTLTPTTYRASFYSHHCTPKVLALSWVTLLTITLRFIPNR